MLNCRLSGRILYVYLFVAVLIYILIASVYFSVWQSVFFLLFTYFAPMDSLSLVWCVCVSVVLYDSLSIFGYIYSGIG